MRNFNSKQKQALYIIQDGKCAICGNQLYQGWHADHVIPYSKGGQTDIINGQALCPRCNLKKGDRYMYEWNKTLRSWQEIAFQNYKEKNKNDFMLVATPGSGKTLFALRIAYERLMINDIERIVIVCPTEHLKKQWARKAKEININIDYAFSKKTYDGFEKSDYHGIATTYQHVAMNPQIYRYQTKRKTFIIFDEIHHAGDGNTWGDSIKYAFENTERLLLSGTPFRSDNSQIPFVNYENGKSKADFRYEYSDALKDSNVCRPIIFPSFEGDMEWISNGKIIKSNFKDSLKENEKSERIRVALSIKGDWLKSVIKEADDKLNEIRENSQPNAGGLIICIDQNHARSICDLVKDVTGIKPDLVISDEQESSSIIDKFSKNNNKWLVSVKMVSEGIDIPRLRIGVYATNVLTEMFFRQAVGRIIRHIDCIDEQNAYFFIYADETLIKFADEIKKERDHAIEEIINEIKKENERGDYDKKEISVIDSQAIEHDVIIDGKKISQEELNYAKSILNKLNLKIDSAQIALILKEAGKINVEKKENKFTETIKDREDKLRKFSKTRVGRLFYVLKNNGYDIHYKDINMKLINIIGVNAENSTIDQLERRLELLENWINNPEVFYG